MKPNSPQIVEYTIKHKFPIAFLGILYFCLFVLLYYVSSNTIVIHSSDQQHVVVDVQDKESGPKNDILSYPE